MAETKWTPDQQRVIDTRNKNILVSASAGSGKTAVLVQRIISLITDPRADVDIDELLVVTFTRAAAAEMKERILKALEKMLEADPSDENVARQMVLIHSANISTIDSFCLDVLRSHYNEIDLDPSFRTGDEGEMKLLRKKVMDELLEECYRRILNSDAFIYEPEKDDEEAPSDGNRTLWLLPEPSELAYCIDCVETGRTSGNLAELITGLYDYSRSYAEPDKWLDECEAVYEAVNDHMNGSGDEACNDSNEAAGNDNNEAPGDDSADITGINDKECDNNEGCDNDETDIHAGNRASVDIMGGICEYICSRIENLSQRMSDLADECRIKAAPGSYEAFFQGEAELLESIRRDLAHEQGDIRSMGRSISQMVFDRIPGAGKKGSYDEAVKDSLMNRRKAIKEEYMELQKEYFYAEPDKIMADIELSGRVIRTLIALTREFAARFSERKRKCNLIDYSDMELMAYSILAKNRNGQVVPTPASRSYANRFKAVMIDEYQDSNYLQEAILSMVSGEICGIPNRFIVGDIKQSIYGFRLSRPELFINKAAEYANSDQGVRIDLQQNFRSREIVLDSVNAVMEKIMIEEVGGINYDESHRLMQGTDRTVNRNPVSEVLLMDPRGGDQDKNAREKEAAMVADRILEMLETEEVYDRGSCTMRPLRLGDIAILVRAARERTDIYRQALMDRGIAAHAESSAGYFNAIEVKCVLDYLKLLDNPLQDIPMASILHSPIGGFTEEELTRIKLACGGRGMARGVIELLNNGNYSGCMDGRSEMLQGDRRSENGSLSDSANIPENNIEDELMARLHSWYSLLLKHRGMIAYMPLNRLIPRILKDTGYDLYLAALPEGTKRLANIDILIERAGAYERTSFKGVFNFLNYLEQLKEQEVDFGEANVCDDQQDVVRIMTIHKSKGLEFPVVFVCDLATQLRIPEKKSLVINGRYKLGMTAVDPAARTKAETIYRKFIKKQNDMEELGEELRILYVAMTRAQDKLILTGTVKDPEAAMDKWNGAVYIRGRLAPEELISCSSRLDILMKAICRLDRLFTITRKNGDDINDVEVLRSGQRLMESELMAHIDTTKVYDGKLLKDIKDRENWSYGYPLTGSGPVKQSVSDIKIKRIQEMDEAGEDSTAPFVHHESVPVIPEFAMKELPGSEEDENVNMGAMRGTAVHRFLELWDYNNYVNDERITVEIDLNDYPPVTSDMVRTALVKMTAEGTMDEQSASLVNVNKMLHFLNSDLGRRMARAALKGRLYREKMFMLGIESEELSLVQGIIDAYFEEDGKLVLLDYKTDRVAGPEDLINRYNVQLKYYADALNRLTDTPVGEILIYSFCFEKELHL